MHQWTAYLYREQAGGHLSLLELVKSSEPSPVNGHDSVYQAQAPSSDNFAKDPITGTCFLRPLASILSKKTASAPEGL